jgi:hypothetical protein
LTNNFFEMKKNSSVEEMEGEIEEIDDYEDNYEYPGATSLFKHLDSK